MEILKLVAGERERKGKSYLKELRSMGEVPAILYGEKAGNQLIKVVWKELNSVLVKGGRNALINLVLKKGQEEEKHNVMVSEIVTESIKGQVLHVDFKQVSLKSKVLSKVAIHLTGEPAGAAEGGTIQHEAWEVEIECLPTNIPETIQVDISELNIGDSIYAKDLDEIEGCSLASDGDTLIVTIVAPRIVEEETPEEAETQGEKKPEEKDEEQKGQEEK